jgi:hypothetical protein
MFSPVSNNQYGHISTLNRQRDRQAKIDAESRIRLVMSNHHANLDEVMVAEPNSKVVRDWRKILCSQMVGEWTAVYQKAWEKCRGNGLAVWHERNDGADGSDESAGDGPNQLTPLQIYDVDESDSEEALGCGQCYACVSGGSSPCQTAPRSEPVELEQEVATTAEPSPSISELVSIVDVLSRTAACGGVSVLRGEVLEKALMALHARL